MLKCTRSFQVCIVGLSIVILILLICSWHCHFAEYGWRAAGSPLLFSLVLHPLALRIRDEFPNLDLGVWYLDDGAIIGSVEDVFKVFQLIEKEGACSGASSERKEE